MQHDTINTNNTNNHKQTTSCHPIIKTITMNEGGNNGRQLLLQRELMLRCRYDRLSEEGLREIVDRHGLTLNHRLSDYTFFLAACRNERVTEGIIRYLLEYFPGAASATFRGWTPLHHACRNKNATLNIIQILIGSATLFAV